MKKFSIHLKNTVYKHSVLQFNYCIQKQLGAIMNTRNNKKDVSLTTFLSWPVTLRAMHLQRKYPHMLPALRTTLLREGHGQ